MVSNGVYLAATILSSPHTCFTQSSLLPPPNNTHTHIYIYTTTDAFQDGTDYGSRSRTFIQGTPGRWHRIKFNSQDRAFLDYTESFWMDLVDGFFAAPHHGNACSNNNNNNNESGAAAGGNSGEVHLTMNSSISQQSSSMHLEATVTDGGEAAPPPVPAQQKQQHLRTQMQLLVSVANSESQFFHQDNARRGITVLLPLVDVSTELGPTELLPGTRLTLV